MGWRLLALAAVGAGSVWLVSHGAPPAIAAPPVVSAGTGGAEPCSTEPADFSPCSSWGTAQVVHVLDNLDPSEPQGISELVCKYTGQAELQMDGGQWSLLYHGQSFHDIVGGNFVCGGESGTQVLGFGLYTLDPLELGYAEESTICDNDQLSFDGTTLSGAVDLYCDPRNRFTYSVTLGPPDEQDDATSPETTEPAAEPASTVPVVTGEAPPATATGDSPSDAAAPAPSSGGGGSPVTVTVAVAGVAVVGTAVAVGVRRAAAKRGVASPPSPGARPPDTAQPSGPSAAARAHLEGRRSEVQAEVDAQVAAYQRAKRERAILVRLLKQNLLKVFLKQALETGGRLGPRSVGDALVDLGKGALPDALRIMDRLFEKHDTSRDAEIIVKMKVEVDRLRAAMDEHIAEVRRLRQEIWRINQQLGAPQ